MLLCLIYNTGNYNMYMMYLYNIFLFILSFSPLDQFNKLCKYAGDCKKNRSRKPMTITKCNQILLKISVIDENEIDDKPIVIPEQFEG